YRPRFPCRDTPVYRRSSPFAHRSRLSARGAGSLIRLVGCRAPLGGSGGVARQHQPQRQTDPRLQAAALTVAQLDAAAVLGGDALDDGQAQAGAASAARPITTDE